MSERFDADELAAELASADGELWAALDPDGRGRYRELAAHAIDYVDAVADATTFTIDDLDTALRTVFRDGPVVERLSEELAEALSVELVP